jgi:predicted esterase
MTLRPMRRLVLSIFVLIACASFAAAQDAGQVLRVWVGYNTLKNSTNLPPEKLAEVERLGKLSQDANVAGKYGDAMKHLLHAITIMRGSEWTPARALSSALTLKLGHTVLEPSGSARLAFGQMFSLDEKIESKLSGNVALFKMQGKEPIKVIKSLDSIGADFSAQPLATDITVPDVEDGNYRLTITLKPAGGTPSAEPITKTITVRIERGLAAKVAAARARLAKTESALKAKKQDALLAELASADYRIKLFDLAGAGEINFERINFSEEIKEANAQLDELDSGRNPFTSRRGDFRKAYLSKVDSTLQPYRIFVPSSYDATKEYPLIIALHGMGGDENSYFDGYQQGAFKTEAGTRGYIVACPKGRQPASMYIGPAERDVMDVVAEVRRAYSIDPNRIYMTGHSMGGFGTWSVAMNNPDVFAALAPVAGGGNPLIMSKIAHIPQLVVHGDDDKTVPVERSRVMVAAAKKLGAEVKYIEIAGGDHVSVAQRTFEEVYDWFDSHRKNVEAKAAGAK